MINRESYHHMDKIRIPYDAPAHVAINISSKTPLPFFDKASVTLSSDVSVGLPIKSFRELHDTRIGVSVSGFSTILRADLRKI